MPHKSFHLQVHTKLDQSLNQILSDSSLEQDSARARQHLVKLPKNCVEVKKEREVPVKLEIGQRTTDLLMVSLAFQEILRFLKFEQVVHL